MSEYKYIGHGVYSIAEAARITRVPATTIRRWTRGYTYTHNGFKKNLGPVFKGVGDDGFAILRFADLMEIMALDSFRKAGVSWNALRVASDKAAYITGATHPFSREKFRTDGRDVLLAIDDETILNVASDEQSFRNFVERYLIPREKLVFSPSGETNSYHPLGKDRTVVIDPARSFGSPICAPSGVRTHLLHSALQAEGKVETVAWWYEVTPTEVEDAIDYEASLAA